MSDVHDVMMQIRTYKASPDANVRWDALVKPYCPRLRSSNLVDCRDVVKVLKEALEDEEKGVAIAAFIRDFLGSCVILVVALDPRVSSEVELLRVMLSASSMKATLLRPESSLDSRDSIH